jgi:hypothetical protein
MALYDSRDFANDGLRPRPQNVTGYLLSTIMVVLIVIIAFALFKSVIGSSSGRASTGPTTVEAVMTPTPVPEPIPATEPRLC